MTCIIKFCNGSLNNRVQPANKVQVFADDILHRSYTTIVCRGEFNHLPCAAKYVHQELALESVWREKFRKGCDFLRNCHHPNIVTFLGLDLCHPLAPVLLTELMDESLEQYLSRSEAPVPLHTQIDICTDVAHGLEYIHAKGYIYGDLIASNVLLKGGRAKIGGFMALIDKSADAQLSLPPGSPPSMPMQSFSFPYDESIDCFSYGILAMHIAIQKAPSSPYTTSEFGSITEMERFETCLDQVDSCHPLKPVIHSCLCEETDRPSAAALATELTAMKDTAEYRTSYQPSEGGIEHNMKAQIRELEREKNRMIIDFQKKKMSMDERVKQKNATVKGLKGEVREKEAALRHLKQENEEHQQEEALLRKKIDDITKTAELCFLAVNFAYQKTHQDYETAKDRAQSLSDKEKQAMEEMEILEKTHADEKQMMEKQIAKLRVLEQELYKVRDERDKAKVDNEEKDEKITELRAQRVNSDKNLAKLLHRAQSQGVELSTD